MNRLRRSLAASLILLLVAPALSHASELFAVSHYSPALQKQTTFNVLMPSQPEPEKRYPVFYLLHGAWGDYQNWVDKTDIEQYADDYDFIVVMPDGGQFGWYVDSPLEATSAYETYITKELVGAVDRLLPTIAGREGRSIAGLSMGGHGALSLAAKHPELFSAASSLSGILQIAAHPEKWHIAARLGPYDASPENWKANSVCELAERFVEGDVKLLFDVGIEDTQTGALGDNRKCHERLTELGVEHTYHELPGTHSWDYWNTHIREHLDFHAANFAARLGRLVSKAQRQEREQLNRWHRYYLDRVEQFREENARLKRDFPDRKTIVLLGSSSVELFFRDRDLLPGWFTLNRGISADRIGLTEGGILHRLQESVFDCNPAHVFILNGRNDLGHTVREGSPSVEEVVACYREVVQRILQGAPGVQVHIITCCPTRDKYETMAPLVPQLNAGLKQIAGELGVDYIDIYSKLVGPDGLLLPEYSSDGLHVKGEAYVIWADAMKAALQGGAAAAESLPPVRKAAPGRKPMSQGWY